MYKTAKPYTRWWWFSHVPLLEEDIEFQLNWLKDSGFGGVELQWTRLFVYRIKDPENRDGPQFLDKQWQEKVEYAKNYASKIGLGCDFTFGTLWPFGGSFVSKQDSMQTFKGGYEKMSDSSFEYPKKGRILNHLSKPALVNYSKVMGGALQNALKGDQSALFCDSWEILSRQIWDPAMFSVFEGKFGYDFEPYANIDILNENPETFRYDYRKMLSYTVTEEFYKAFTDIAHDLNAITRVQCHGSPTDLISSYSSVDIPESEALLFPVEFSRIAASAAALSGRPLTSCETFTCIYGFPSWHFKREFLGDLKLLADAVVANGVNRIVYHGMPYNGPSTKNTFYATVHVGPDSPFASNLPAFNLYLTDVCELMTKGDPVHQMAVYFPVEDNFIKDMIPKDERVPGSLHHFEMRSVFVPKETEGYHPLWVTNTFLRDATFDPSTTQLQLGKTTVSVLYVDCQWLDVEALHSILHLAKSGLQVIVKNWDIKQPGFKKDETYQSILAELQSIPNVIGRVTQILVKPLVSTTSEQLPFYWARKNGSNLVLFFAHPLCRKIKYPMPYLLSKKTEEEETKVYITIHWQGNDFPIQLVFGAYQSIVVNVAKEEEGESYQISFEAFKSDFIPPPPPRNYDEDDDEM